MGTDNDSGFIFVLAVAFVIGMLVYLGITHLRVLEIISGLFLGTLVLIFIGFGVSHALKRFNIIPRTRTWWQARKDLKERERVKNLERRLEAAGTVDVEAASVTVPDVAHVRC